MSAVQEVYLALFGRPADPGGLAYWNAVTRDGGDLGEMLRVLPSLAEYTSRFTGQSPEQVITTIYQSLFRRNPDPTGLEYFTAELASGAQNMATIAVNILHGAQGGDKADIVAKIDAAGQFTAALDTQAKIEAYQGEAASALARSFLNIIDRGNAATPDTAAAAVARVLDPTTAEPVDVPGSVTIEGIKELHHLLTARVSDGNGLTGTDITYSWYADGDLIMVGVGANVLNPGMAAFGKAITVKADYTDNQGFAGSVTSAATAPIAVGHLINKNVVIFAGAGPVEFDSISDAVAAADTVWDYHYATTIYVKPGTYTENIVIHRDVDLMFSAGTTLAGTITVKNGVHFELFGGDATIIRGAAARQVSADAEDAVFALALAAPPQEGDVSLAFATPPEALSFFAPDTPSLAPLGLTPSQALLDFG